MSFVAIGWNLDTTLLAARNTVFGSSVEVGSGVWGGTLVDRVERAVGLALLYLACLSEKPRVDTRLARDPGIGDGSRNLEKDKRKGMHCEEVVSKCSEVIYSRWLESMIIFSRVGLLLITFRHFILCATSCFLIIAMWSGTEATSLRAVKSYICANRSPISSILDWLKHGLPPGCITCSR